MIIIDKIDSFLTGDLRNFENEQSRTVLESLKNLSRLIRIPILFVTGKMPSDNRRSRRSWERPTLEDVGMISDYADTILFLHRLEHLGVFENEEGESTRGIAELMVAKQMQGVTGNTSLRFDKEYLRFKSMENANPLFQVNEHLKMTDDSDDDCPF